MRTLAWPLDTAELHHLRDRLRFEFCKWDVFHRGRDDLLPDALVLSADEHAQLVSIAQGCWRALRPMETKLARQPEALDAIGMPQGLHRVLDEDFGDRFDGLRPAGDLRPALLQAFAPFPRIGLVYATGYSLDLQPMALLDQPIDAIYRYYPAEWLGDLPNHDCVEPGTAQMNRLVRWYLEHWEPAPGIGFFQIGGGIAGDFPICVVPLIAKELQIPEVPAWGYFCQVGDAPASYGGYSGAPPNEKIAWGKLWPDTPRFAIQSDATIVVPLMLAYYLLEG